MKLRKFFGLTSRAVLEQIRAELGPDAVIVANRPTADGIEITAVAGDAMQSILDAGAARRSEAMAEAPAAPPTPGVPESAGAARLATAASATASTPSTPPVAPSAPAGLSWLAALPGMRAPAVEPVRPDQAGVARPFETAQAPVATSDTTSSTRHDGSGAGLGSSFESQAPASAPDGLAADAGAAFRDSAPDRASAGGTEALADRFSHELAAMRSLIEEQLAQLAWSDTLRRSPLRGRLTRVLLEAGYSNALAREIMHRLPDDFSAAQAQEWLVSVLARNVRCAASEYDIVTRGGVYALVGPTGVGKTTTTAKLAARCAVRYGAAKLALLTTDSYRVGAHDQLRIYAKILGVPVHTVSDQQDLRQALDSMRGKHLVLIDTVGMSQRDERVREQSMLLAQPEVQRMLLLNAAAQSETLEEVVAAYTRAPELASAPAVTGCVLTKVDEAGQLGQALDVLIRHRLLLHYTSGGQRVPEDLHEPSAAYLVHRSLRRGPKPTAFTLDDEAFSLIGGGAGVAHA